MVLEKGSVDRKDTEEKLEYFYKNEDTHLPDKLPKKNGKRDFDYFADLMETSEEIQKKASKYKKDKKTEREDIERELRNTKRMKDMLEIDKMTPELAKKAIEDEKQIIKWFKTEKIAQVVTHGGNRLEGRGKDGQDVWNPTPDLDAQSAVILLNEYNKKKLKDIYTKNAVSSIVPKGGDQGDLEVDKSSEGLVIWVDAGGRWMEVDNKGEKKVIYLDHHGEGRRSWTSATEMMYEMMREADILKEEKWMKNYVYNITSFDNLSYVFAKKHPFNTDTFQNAWPRSLHGLARDMYPKDIIDLYKTGKVKNFDELFTDEDLEGEIGKIKLKNSLTVKEFVEKETSLDPEKSEVAKTLGNIENSAKYAINKGLDLFDTQAGNLIYNNVPTIDGKRNIIPHHLAFLGTRANNFDTYIILNHPKGRDRNRTFFINSNYPGFEKVLKRLKRNKRIALVDIHGVMIKGETNLTERDFLGVFDEKIIKKAHFPKSGELPKHIKTNSAEKKEESQKTEKSLPEIKPKIEIENKTARPNMDEGIEDPDSILEKNEQEKTKKIQEIKDLIEQKIKEKENVDNRIADLDQRLAKIEELIKKIQEKDKKGDDTEVKDEHQEKDNSEKTENDSFVRQAIEELPNADKARFEQIAIEFNMWLDRGKTEEKEKLLPESLVAYLHALKNIRKINTQLDFGNIDVREAEKQIADIKASYTFINNNEYKNGYELVQEEIKKIEGSIRKIEKGENKKEYSIQMIKDQIVEMLKSVKEISSIEKINLEIKEQDIMNIDIMVSASGFNVGIKAEIGNTDKSIALKSHNIKAKWPAEGIAKKAVGPYLSKIPDLLKSYIEKKENKKVESIQISAGAVQVLFEKNL